MREKIFIDLFAKTGGMRIGLERACNDAGLLGNTICIPVIEAICKRIVEGF